MKIANVLSMALLTGLSIPAWTSQSSAAANHAGADTMTRCLGDARRHYPGKYYDWGEVRDFSYEACMRRRLPS
jgi:hypothetical protein